jgi:glutathione peroxidase
MRTIIITAMFLILAVALQAQEKKSFYDFKAVTIDGKPIDLSTFKGKRVLVVNTASKCGYTSQYAELEELFKTYGGDHFTVIGFPANNFMGQEPGSNSEIREFCTSKYDVTFPMMSKISVKGKDIDPLYGWLTSKEQNGLMDAPVKWNFQKFLIDENGNLAGMAPTKESPTSERIVTWIKTGKISQP